MSPHRNQGTLLTELAREAIGETLGFMPQLDVEKLTGDFPWLKRLGATFVTLTIDGQLRGCIGSLEASRPLIEDLRGNARAAAFRDSRFWPRPWTGLNGRRGSVRVVRAIGASSHHRRGLREAAPLVDGVVSKARTARFCPRCGNFDPREFLRHLRRKAGLKPDHWSRTCVCIYSVEKFHSERRNQAPRRRSPCRPVTPPTARHWHVTDQRISATCVRGTTSADGQRGACFVHAEGNQLVLDTYGRSSGFCVDPIEKNP